MREKDLQKDITDFLKENCIPYYKTDGGIKRFPGKDGQMHMYVSQVGFPDLFIFTGGQVLLVELKNEKGKLRDTQIKRFSDLERHGIPVYIVRPADWELAKNQMDINWAMKNHYTSTRTLFNAIVLGSAEEFHSDNYA